MQSATQTALTVCYNVAGRLLRVEALDDWSAQWLAGFLSGFYLTPAAAGSSSPAAITLRVRRAEPPAIPPGLPVFEISQGSCYVDEARYFLDVDESLVRIAAPEARLIDVWFGETPHAQHPVALVNIFGYGLQAALRRAGVYDLHAAGVLEPVSNAGAIFIGGSGSGKSTLALRLAVAGWRYLSDDMLVLREDAEGLHAEGFRRVFAVTEPTLAGCELPGLAAALGAPFISDPSKRRLEPGVVFPGAYAPSCRPRALFFSTVTGADETRLTPMSPQVAMQRLVRFCPWATYDRHAAPDYLRVLARLANQCRAFELHAGRDLLLEPARTAELLTPYMKE